jgi:hypothetical protein
MGYATASRRHGAAGTRCRRALTGLETGLTRRETARVRHGAPRSEHELARSHVSFQRGTHCPACGGDEISRGGHRPSSFCVASAQFCVSSPWGSHSPARVRVSSARGDHSPTGIRVDSARGDHRPARFHVSSAERRVASRCGCMRSAASRAAAGVLCVCSTLRGHARAQSGGGVPPRRDAAALVGARRAPRQDANGEREEPRERCRCGESRLPRRPLTRDTAPP